jgi:AcrR family transcriptional regulator
LAASQRRDQLVGLGRELTRSLPVDRLALEQVTKAAGISKALLFHYFPTKRHFQVAIVQAAADDLLRRIDVDRSLPPLARLEAGVEAFVDFIEAEATTYLSIVRGAGSDEALLEVFESTRQGVVDLIVEGLGVEDASPSLRVAVRGWVALIEETTLAWLPARPMSRAELVDLIMRTSAAILPVVSELLTPAPPTPPRAGRRARAAPDR